MNEKQIEEAIEAMRLTLHQFTSLQLVFLISEILKILAERLKDE